MSILFELERMERLAEDLDRLRRPVRIPVSCYKRMEGKRQSLVQHPGLGGLFHRRTMGVSGQPQVVQDNG